MSKKKNVIARVGNFEITKESGAEHDYIRIKAISGVITRQIPSIVIAGTWKVIDLPPPVGIRPSVSFPAQTERMISSCKGRKAGYPQYFPNILW